MGADLNLTTSTKLFTFATNVHGLNSATHLSTLTESTEAKPTNRQQLYRHGERVANTLANSCDGTAFP